MVRSLVAAAAAALCLAAAAPASATLYDWVLTGADHGVGTLTTGAADNGGYDITAFTGTINSIAVGGLLGGQPGGSAASPSGAFVYDNIVFPNAAQVLDGWGILIAISGVEGNIWGNFAGTGGYSYYEGTCGGCYSIQNNADTFSLTRAPFSALSDTAIPEPATLSLLGFGLTGISLLRRRARSK